MELHDTTKTSFYVGLKTAEHKTHIHPAEVIDVIREYVEGGTFKEGKGLWKGETENSIVFEVIGLEDSMTDHLADEYAASGAADSPAEYLKKLLEVEFDQDSVMVEKTDVEVAF